MDFFCIFNGVFMVCVSDVKKSGKPYPVRITKDFSNSGKSFWLLSTITEFTGVETGSGSGFPKSGKGSPDMLSESGLQHYRSCPSLIGIRSNSGDLTLKGHGVGFCKQILERRNNGK